MENVKVLDCTLRDGGYCNEWKFGNENIKKIVCRLSDAGIDIIECGFLTNKVTYNPNVTKFTSVEEVAAIIPPKRNGITYVCMINYGEYLLKELPEYDGRSLDGIRVAFHKKNLLSALTFCKGVREKGYKVFVQAMVSLNYTDEEFLDLIQRVNTIHPYAFYIVDSFGVMKQKDLVRLFYMVDHNLDKDIQIGYHSHNNMQLAYSNAQALVDIRTKRNLILDSSVYGMGRGAGNLNTELLVEYLNDNIGTAYDLRPLLSIIDEILNDFYHLNYWGYSLPNYLSAKHNVHPNYAGYLDSKKTLTVENMDEIFSMMEEEKRSEFDKTYIEGLYVQYMEKGEVHENHFQEFKGRIYGKNVLIIAPGKSSAVEKGKILSLANREKVITISVNFDYPSFETDFIFLSNLRRYRELDVQKRKKCIVTSNIPAMDCYLQTKYRDLLNSYESVRDNAGMMLIKYLIMLGAQKIWLAGFDGYSLNVTNNYAEQKMNFYTQKATFEALNAGMNAAIADFAKQIDIEFLTTPHYIKF